MKINLKRNWFAPNGEFYRVDNNPVQVPDSLKDVLPRDAKVLGPKDIIPVKEKQKPEVLRDFDTIRAAEEAKPT